MTRWTQCLLVCGFVLALAVPPVATLSGVDGADPVGENRTVAPSPPAPTSWASAVAFLPAFDLWFSDHFAFRDTLVRAYGRSRYLWLGMSSSSGVVTARDGWLFYVDDGGLDNFTNAKPFSEAELVTWRSAVKRAHDWCAARGITYMFMVAPDKTEIYPELFPRTARRVSSVSRTDQLYTALSDLGVVIDVRPSLLREKSTVRVFEKTDSHWNPRGAFVAYQHVIKALRTRTPTIPPAATLAEFEPGVRRVPSMDLAGMMGLKRVLGEEQLVLRRKQARRYVRRDPIGNIVEAGEGRIVTEIPGSTLPSAVVFRDSFTAAMAPFLSEHFRRVVYLWRNDFAADEVLAEHPDVVLQEIVSRHIQYYEPSPELIPVP